MSANSVCACVRACVRACVCVCVTPKTNYEAFAALKQEKKRDKSVWGNIKQQKANKNIKS